MWAPLGVLALAAAAGAIATAGSAIEIVCVAVLAATTVLLGWRLGESNRMAL